MARDKKLWFHKVIGNIYWPISWEGWLVSAGTLAVAFLIMRLNGITFDKSISVKGHWSCVAELIALIVAFYWLIHGRVRK